MKQLIQYLDSGKTELLQAPRPQAKSGHLLIESSCSLISAGTERMLLNFSKASYLQKAKQQPEKVKQVLDKVRTDGLLTTYDAVKSKLSEPIPLGYCNVGKVLEIGNDTTGFQAGDRVISNGPHADLVRVARNLCAKIPDNVDDESAAFTVLASIALQGIRLAKPTLGETVVVTGTGLIGLMAIQLLRANGCRVLAIDFDEQKLELARKFGAHTCNPAKGEDPVEVGLAYSRGRGVDAVIITASTQSSDPVSQAAQMSRQRGRIILVGVTGLELNRAEFYEKELRFQVSCSYGPGRYDPAYEDKGQDYPLGFVRWTEQRNFEAILDMMSMGQLDVSQLITHRYVFSDANGAYQTLTQDPKSLGILLKYEHDENEDKLITSVSLSHSHKFHADKPIIGFIGAGNYASRMLIPAFKEAGAQLHSIATSGGTSGVVHGEKNQFSEATTDTQAMLGNPQINTIAVVTRHNSHAGFVCTALENGKNVFVEKPLAINTEQLEQVDVAYRNQLEQGYSSRLMVGFNRRFSPHIVKMKSLLEGSVQAKSIVITVNAGAIPQEHWTQDPSVGGGRIIGEACHFIDLMRYLVSKPISSVKAQCLSSEDGASKQDDVATITLDFEDGSFGIIHYFANGAASFPKERVEVFAGGKILQLDNFRKLKGYGYKDFSKLNLWQQDKGHKACAKAFLDAIQNGQACPISYDELYEVAAATIEVAKQLDRQ
jgi:predicted dehydrogenase/threonine dehydrogenase-like Zn-dependent dehydrogenase